MDPVLLKAVEAIEELNFHNRKKAREREESVSSVEAVQMNLRAF